MNTYAEVGGGGGGGGVGRFEKPYPAASQAKKLKFNA